MKTDRNNREGLLSKWKLSVFVGINIHYFGRYDFIYSMFI